MTHKNVQATRSKLLNWSVAWHCTIPSACELQTVFGRFSATLLAPGQVLDPAWTALTGLVSPGPMARMRQPVHGQREVRRITGQHLALQAWPKPAQASEAGVLQHGTALPGRLFQAVKLWSVLISHMAASCSLQLARDSKGSRCCFCSDGIGMCWCRLSCDLTLSRTTLDAACSGDQCQAQRLHVPSPSKLEAASSAKPLPGTAAFAAKHSTSLCTVAAGLSRQLACARENSCKISQGF